MALSVRISRALAEQGCHAKPSLGRESDCPLKGINGAVSALRFLFNVTLKRRDLSQALFVTRIVPPLPEVLSIEEAARLLQSAPGTKYLAALGVAYGAGLRVSEVAHLTVDDIDSTRMLIRVEQGKGGKDRNTMLSPQLPELLRMWWREGRKRGVLREAALKRFPPPA